MNLLIALILVPAFTVGPAESLETRVTAFWDLMVAGNKAAALEYVSPDTKNAFINRQDGGVAEWKLDSIETQGDEARVTVVLQRRIGNLPGLHATRVSEVWRLIDGNWFVQVQSMEQTLRTALDKSHRAPKPQLTGSADVKTRQVRIHFVNASQHGTITIFNGTDGPISVSNVELDDSRFQLLQGLENLASGETGRFYIEYIGTEIEKDLNSKVAFSLVGDGQETRHEVPVLYNYITKGLKRLFRLSDEQVAKMTRDDIKDLKLKPPEGPQPPPPPIPKPKPPSNNS